MVLRIQSLSLLDAAVQLEAAVNTARNRQLSYSCSKSGASQSPGAAADVPPASSPETSAPADGAEVSKPHKKQKLKSEESTTASAVSRKGEP